MDIDEAEEYLIRLGWVNHSYGAIRAVCKGLAPVSRGEANLIKLRGKRIEKHHMSFLNYKKNDRPLICFAPKEEVSRVFKGR